MGLTHYWECEKELPKDRFSKATNDCRSLFEQIDIKLSGVDGTGEPEFSHDAIAFNGSNGLSCEPFSISRINTPRHGRKKFLGYCKTEHLPYNTCVQAALIILKHYCQNNITVTSDAKDLEWKVAKDLCQKFLGYGLDFVLSKNV